MRIVDYGRFSIKDSTDIADSTLLMSKRFVGGSNEIIEQTSTIPVALGTVFCLRFVIDGRPVGESSKLRINPSPGISDPKTGVLHTVDEYNVPMVFGKPQSTCYRFESPTEMVLGKWVREVWYEGRKLGLQEFTVVAPQSD